MQAPGGREEDTDGGFAHGGWSMPYFDFETMGPAISEVMQGTEALLFGRRTWQTMAAAWPGRAGDPFADRMNEICKYVASRTLVQDDLYWNNSTLLSPNDVLDVVGRLRAEEGGALQVMGSPTLAGSLISAGMVDEYRLMIEPIVLGGGKASLPRRPVPTPRAGIDHDEQHRRPPLHLPSDCLLLLQAGSAVREEAGRGGGLAPEGRDAERQDGSQGVRTDPRRNPGCD